ncbi:MAG: OmpA family protein [Salinivirgaceae bacterium]|nr:OmpA family protein [Salinivirgaceae bacterium]
MMKKIFAVAIVVMASVYGVSAQKSVTAKADKAYAAGKYYEAIDEYKYAFAKAKNKDVKNAITFRVAECYHMAHDNRQTIVWCRKAIKKGETDARAYLWLGDALCQTGEYTQAIEEYKTYKKLNPSDKHTDDRIEACAQSIEWVNSPTRYTVENMHYINSKYSDYAPAFAKDDYNMIMFTSSRDGVTGGKISGVTGEYFSDIFRSRADRKGKWSEPVALSEPINTEFDEGTPCTNLKCNTLYFTSFREDKNKNLSCRIYVSTKDGAEWGEPKELKLANDTISVGHPAISPDELTLLFVADMPGGQGGKDIWQVTRPNKNADWGKPENLGPEINTDGDEMFPYIHPDGALYFSSNGHPGMGGLDIFCATKLGDKWKIENLKYPINSCADDFGIIFQQDMERGFFTSNRAGGKGGDDIYLFALPPIEFALKGVVKNKKTEEIIAGADVTLIGSDGTNVAQKTETDGTFTYKLNPNTDYRIVVKRGGFLNSKDKVSTKGLTSSTELPVEINLAPDDSRMDLPGIVYEFGKWNLLPSSMVSLEALVEILNDNSNITIEIGSHTDFRGSDQANLELSKKRAKSVVDFLITYGIDEERLSSRGYGETMPKEVDRAIARIYPFLKEGDVLTEQFINNLKDNEQREICHQINRRTDFGLTGRDYVPKVKRRK